MSNLIVYPPGAGGNFLLSLLDPNVIKENNNEWVTYNTPDMKLDKPSDIVGKCDKYQWFKSHNPYFLSVPCFENKYMISTLKRSTQLYCNTLLGLKVQLNRGRCPDIETKIHKKWNLYSLYGTDLSEYWQGYKYFSYEQIFFDLDLKGTLWEGKQAEVSAYHQQNIELVKKHGYSQYVPQV